MIVVDARGDVCPVPVIKTKKALEEASERERVEVLVDNDIAFQNVQKYGNEVGNILSAEKKSEQEYHIVIEGKEKEDELKKQETNCIYVIRSNAMGVGDEALGKTLLKGFFYALTQVEGLPKKILFYNSGAYLTTSESESLEDIKYLESQGVEILTCGTCLDFYGLKDKLEVGNVTNMYAIVEAMNQADKIVTP
ncbi:selenium metabolism protein YedF [Aequitasia blattaphilus]|uniref:Sulfurtransferase-like selenium metabolism protein YedF n=1 Tax=Aequitasia blattaphilus TaxID=2949332 RepID=A0ABT1EAM9_9FIRM|nr:sulfurtransferase-like selenium metabolism protein YedF [Aequitasia blattaphilus]MCP1102885.1 sulfurtransferase-like selenium metabolism protein YedF [Aequitasia blattaphilus]MCR8615525.1 sulfurtransferase-like selenium metabolism protein YedF [Aequitasia blattaphilus]